MHAIASSHCILTFSDKNWKRRGINNVKKGAQNWFTWSSYRKWQTTHIPQLCGAAWSSRWLMVLSTNGQHTCELVFKPMRTFWTYVVTINLFSLYLMNFMLHAMLDATGVVLRVHYNSMKSDVSFLQGRVRTIFRWGIPFSYMSNKISSSLQQCKNYKNRWRFSKVMITNVLPPFLMVHSV